MQILIVSSDAGWATLQLRCSRRLPAIFIGPEKGENGLTSDWQCGRRQVEHVDAEPGVARLRILITLPPVDTPMHNSCLSNTMRRVLYRGTVRHLLLNLHPKICRVGFSVKYRFTVWGGWSKILPSRRDRRSFIYSECAQTSGQAEPVGLPRKSSSGGISEPSQICSGSKRPCPAGTVPSPEAKLRLSALAGSQRVVGTLAR